MLQNINPFEENSPVGQMQVSTASGLPQFKANVTISYVVADKEITLTPSGLSANTATMYDLVVVDAHGKKTRLKVNLATPAAVTVDLDALGFDLTKDLRWTFIANRENYAQTLSFSRTFSPTNDYSKNFTNL